MAMQLALNVSLDDDATFANFYIGDNAAAVDAIKHQLVNSMAQSIFVWGAQGSGRSHLLQASCHQSVLNGESAWYVSLQDLDELSPAIFDDLERCKLVALDDLQCLEGRRDWQEAVFHFYNRAQQTGARLLFAADMPPRRLPYSLADLISRMCHGLVFQLQALDDQQKIAAISLRAKNRGLELSSGVGAFLLGHYKRDMAALFHLLEKIDIASIAAKRRITLPFVKHVLESQGVGHA